MTRQTIIALRPNPPPPLSCAPRLPANVRIPAAFPPAGDHAGLQEATAAPLLIVPVPAPPTQPPPTPPQWNRIISFPSAAHRASSDRAARARTEDRYSSNRDTVRDGLWTRKSISIAPWKAAWALPPPDDQLELKMISTTRRDECPDGSSVSVGMGWEQAGPARTAVAGEADRAAGRDFGLPLGFGLGFLGREDDEDDEECLGKRKTASLRAWEELAQDVKSGGFLEVVGRQATSSKALVLQCRDFTHPVAIKGGSDYGTKE